MCCVVLFFYLLIYFKLTFSIIIAKRKAHKVTWPEVQRGVEKKFLAKLMYALRKIKGLYLIFIIIIIYHKNDQKNSYFFSIKGFKSAARAPKLFGNTNQHQNFFEGGVGGDDEDMEDKAEQEELKRMKDKKAMKKQKHADLAGEDAVSQGLMNKKEEMVGYGEDDEAMEEEEDEEKEKPVAATAEDEEDKESFKDMLETNFLREYKFYKEKVDGEEKEGLRFVLSFPASTPKILMLDLIEREGLKKQNTKQNKEPNNHPNNNQPPSLFLTPPPPPPPKKNSQKMRHQMHPRNHQMLYHRIHHPRNLREGASHSNRGG